MRSRSCFLPRAAPAISAAGADARFGPALRAARLPSMRSAAAMALVLGVSTTARAADPARYEPPPDAPYQAEEVRVHPPDGNYSLGGTLTLPRDGHRVHPAFVLISDDGAQDRDTATPGSNARLFYWISDTLTRLGVAVLRLDDRGVGSSTGSLDSTTTFDRSLDTRAALEYLRARGDMDSRRLGLLGLGEGGLIAQTIAADDTLLAGLVLMAPRNATDSLATALLARVPVLILQGAHDELVPPDHAEALAAAFRAAGNRSVTLRMLDGIGHEFVEPPDRTDANPPPSATLRVSSSVLGTIGDWAGKWFEPRPDPPPRVFAARSRHRGRRHR